jgi:hypothetical protein
MSADVWLEYDGERVTVDDDPDAQMREMIPRRSPGEVTSESFNLTYNLNRMLHAAGFYGWKSIKDEHAGEVGRHLRDVHNRLIADSDRFRAYNPSNGWGSYEDAVAVIGGLASACEAHPDAMVRAWL